MLTVDRLQKSYGKLTAVDGVSFEIPAGEAFGLLGPNGAGKTTTISMLIGLLEPDGGSITINGGVPQHSATRRQIGLAPQSVSLYEELTCRENLIFFGRLYGYSGSDLRARVDWALEFSGLGDRARGRVATFSGGMKRRLNLACALIHEPKLLLMDEPTAGVDPQSRNHLFECIERLKSEGITIIYTTHYMEEAQRMCDRVAIMDHGKLLALDTVDGLIRSHGGQSVVLAELQQVPEQVAALAGHLDGLSWRLESVQPLEDIAQATEQGVKFQRLQVTQPDLESVFLSLTGRSLRD